jgi:hypothetical protein
MFVFGACFRNIPLEVTMKLLAILARLLIVVAALGFVAAIAVKFMGGTPVAFGLYPRSFMNFVDACLLFAIALLLLEGRPAKKK